MAALLRSSVALLLLTGAAHAGSAATCADQDPCLSFAITPVATAAAPAGCSGSGKCAYQVCMTTTLGGACPKGSGETFSHSCVKDPTSCKANEASFDGLTAVQGIGALTQCQIGYSGAKLYFMLKDGAGCGGAAESPYKPAIATAWAGAAVTCQGRPDAIKSCTGNAAGMECVWTVTVPSCPTTTDTAPVIGADDLTASACASLDIPTNYLRFDSGAGPSCSIDQAVAQLQASDPTCTILSSDCQVIKCANPLPDPVLAGLSTMSC